MVILLIKTKSNEDLPPSLSPNPSTSPFHTVSVFRLANLSSSFYPNFSGWIGRYRRQEGLRT